MAEKPGLSPVKLALAEIRELRSRLDALERDRSEPIAIVGLAGRFPGAGDAEQLWQLLRDGRIAIDDVPADRWDVAGFFDADPDVPGKMYARRGGFLPGVDQFDPHFFGISPREAVSMDPQQRLLLEMAWRALEDAAIPPSALAGTQTGVFVGLSNIDYYRMAFGDRAAIDPYFGSGTSGSVAAGRLSYVLGLRGPSLTVDTACSSSLVAIHLAVQSLRNKECAAALAGGVNLILTPDINIACSKAKMIAPDGLCKTFDARADGYVRSEGCAVVVLKRLSDAQKDGDRVLALIRGSAVNQDGRSSGLTVPNGPSQEAVIRRALEGAGVRPDEVAYVEAHGTGTSLGDPIEARALGRVFADRAGGQPLAIGSIKTNIGHLEAAAGIAGLAKVVLALTHEELPGHPQLGDRNPHIEWNDLPLDVPAATRPWPRGDRRRIAGVSSFGFSGTNAHLVVEEAPAADGSVSAPERTREILTLSAKTPEALEDHAAAFERLLKETREPLAEICATANAGRSHAAHRIAVVGTTAAEIAGVLARARSGEDTTGVFRGTVEGGAPEPVFLFTGQGAQYPGMARTLYDTHPAFRQTLDACDRLLAGELERPLLGVLFGGEDETRLLSQTAYAQPALFAVEYALAELWRSWGVAPSAVLGHSVGELVAACVAGVFTLEDGLRLIAARGRLMQALPDQGAMVSVFADEATVRVAIAGLERSVSVAAINGPEQVVISGTRDAVAGVAAALATRGVRSRDLEASRAFHSPLLDPMLEAFGARAAAIAMSAPRLPIISNLTGERAGADIATAEYWVRHARQPVKFEASICGLREAGHTSFMEIGPAPTLVAMARRFADADGVRWIHSLRQGRDDWDEMLAALASLYVGGAGVDWVAFDAGHARRRIAVPGHPFRRQRYWLAADGSTQGATTQAAPGPLVHPLLGRRVDTPLQDVVFEQRFSPGAPAYLAEHRVFDAVVFPATGYLEMALAAGQAVASVQPVVEDLVIGEPLLLASGGERRVQAVFTPRGDRDGAFQVFSRTASGEGAEWHLHASATIHLERADVPSGDSLADARERCTAASAPDEHYDLFSRSGLDYGPSFRGITGLWRGAAEAVGEIALPADVSTDGYTLHPGLLDSCFHVLLAALPGGAAAFTGRHFYLPVSIERLAARGSAGSRAWAHARLRPTEGDEPEAFTGDVTVFDEKGAVVASIAGLTAKRATSGALKAAAERARTDWFYQVEWQPSDAVEGTALARGAWFVIDDGSPLAAAAIDRLRERGDEVDRAPAAQAADALDAWAARCSPSVAARILYFASGHTDWTASPAGAVERLQKSAALFARISARLAVHSSIERVCAITAGATGDGDDALDGQPVLSLVSALGAEHSETPCVAVDVEIPDAAVLDAIWREITAPDAEDRIAYRGGRRHVARLKRAAADAAGSPASAAAAAPVALTISERGILDNLRLEPLARRSPGPREVELEVAAAGLNFRDVLNALGLYPGDPGALGNECVGTVTAIGSDVTGIGVGERVMALVHGGFQTFAVAPADWVVRMPDGMAFHAAATVPMAFTTAEYSLNRLAALRRGERVLIHAATGGVGLAAVQLAQRAGAEIFATAGSDEKRAVLRAMGVRHVMNSRTVEFADEILAATGGEGVDVVLNSLTGDAIPKSLSVLRNGGRFCEIGKRGIWSPEEVAAVRPDVAYFKIFLAEVDAALIQEMLRDLAARFASGELEPLRRRVFALTDASAAFRLMAQARHIGKVVLSRDAPGARGGMREDGSYLITGGFGGLGLRVAQAFADAGAKHLVLVGRSGPGEAAREAIAALEGRGVSVKAVAADVSRESDVADLFSLVSDGPRLAGVVHAAGVRDDGLLSALDAEKVARVLAPKLAGGWHLHRFTEQLDLDFFVLFSSAASVLPSPAQGNYAAANAFLDALARYRRAQGLPAVSINWGPWDEIGMAAGLSAREQQRWARHGVAFIRPEEGLRALQRVLHARVPQVAVVAADWKKFARERPGGIRLLTDLAGAASDARAGAPAGAPRASLREELERLTPARRRDAVLAHVRDHVRQVLALGAGFNLQPHQGLRDVGMDSLMALELRNRLQRTTGTSLPATLTFDRPTVEALTAYLCDEVLHIDREAAVAEAQPAPAAGARPDREPVAIVGLACRVPGAADAESFWRLLRDGVDAISEVPRDRWDIDRYYDPDPDKPGRMYTRYGGFIERVDGFDPAFFGISPREAVSLDPQQRLLLEVAWEALEHAGQPADALLGTRSGVFVGISTYDYALLHMKTARPAEMDTHFGTGNSLSVAAGRLAYSLGLQGPCMAVDTACSSSLVAVHLAVRSLRSGECRMALAGGVNLMLTPEPTVNGCRARMLSADGRCKTFDASADGYVRGEGAGVLVLKRLADAVADGDTVYAVIRGTAVNQDGRSSGLTVPNGVAQQAVIREALADGGVIPSQVAYVEAHGTGTSLGDPIEMEALRAALTEGRAPDAPLVVGSVKTNIGHLEAAAGVVGLIKVTLALGHGEIPPHLHFRTLNPHIDLEGVPIVVARERQPWSAEGGTRIAGVSSFGFSGTNAHVVLEGAPAPAEAETTVERPLELLTLSAKTEGALSQLAGAYREALRGPSAAFADFAHTANTGRAHFAVRAAVVAASAEEAAHALEAAAAGRAHAALQQAHVPADARPQVAFLFTGQGSQYAGMGRRLYDTQRVFRAAIDRCAAALDGRLAASLLDALYPSGERAPDIDQTAFTQPALFAVEVALAELWQSWGIRPAAVLGHSVGEYAAACTAGVFSAEDGMRLIAARAALMQALPAGSMAAVLAPERRVRDLIAPFSERLSVAAINGPEHVVVSGETPAIEAVLASCETQGVRAQRLTVSHAFHSAMMDPILDEFERVASGVRFSAPRVPLISNVTGASADGEIASAAYWRRHVRVPVQFTAGIEALAADGCTHFLEIGPKPVLTGMARRIVQDEARTWLPSLRPPREDWAQLLESLGSLYVAGAPVDWPGFDAPYRRSKVALPTYPFERQRYWIETAEERPSVEAAADPRFCELAWRAIPPSSIDPALAGGGWIVLGSDDALTSDTIERLSAAGGRCLRVHDAAARTALPEAAMTVDPLDVEDFRKCLAHGRARLGGVRGIVHLWGAEAGEVASLEQLHAASARGCAALLHLVQAIGNEGAGAAPQLFVVSRGSWATGAEPRGVSVAQAALWGLVQSVSAERPDLRVVAIDLDPDGSGDAEAVWRELVAAAAGEDRVASRAGRRLVPRLVVARPVATAHAAFVSDATYVITGGSGGLGLAIAQWSVERGARHLVMVARRQPSEAASAALHRLESAGARVTMMRGDVADPLFVSGLFAELDRSHPPVRGVIHAAGVLDDGVVAQQDWTRFSGVLAAKIDGAWNLHDATRERALDFFVMCSSTAAVIGSAGQASYAAGNAFMDALAHHRRSLGLPASAVNWGPWAAVGMASRLEERQARWSERGITPLPPSLALDALARLIADGRAQCAVLDVNWERFTASLPGGARPLLREIAPASVAAVEAASGPAPASSWRGEIAAAARWRRRDLLVERVREAAARVMRVQNAAGLDARQGLRELGLDSLMAVELRDALQRAVGEPLSATVAFDHPSVEALADYLLVAFFDAAVTSNVPAPAAADLRAEPIAIVGVGCRMPGGADTPEAFWTLLREGVDAISEVPRERWDVDALYDPDPAAPGKMYSRWGGFLRDVDRFDPRFFGIAPREAVFMDPQQRLLLEVSWEALERAGQAPEALAGSRTGVFMGVSTYDYMQMAIDRARRDRLDPYIGTGNSPSVVAGRLSYVYGFQGPALSVDTACSSSLVAVHLACQSLRNDECRLALAGGVNLILLPESNVILSKARMLSPDGRCKTFDASANGYVRSDGCGVVILKRLSDAVADGDHVLAVIRGTAVNQDGRSSGLTVPNGPAQETLIRRALAVSGVQPGEVSYVEAHGTGTPLGDPIELRALAAALAEGRGAGSPILVGSVKTNIGHLEAAAGIAGLIKVVLALQHDTIPPHLHFTEPNPHVPWSDMPISIPTRPVPWPSGKKRIAGLSSFGFSGTNAHAIIEEAPRPAAPDAAVPDRPVHLLTLSARSADALAELASRYERMLAQDAAAFPDVCFTANTGRSHFDTRAAIRAAGPGAARQALRALVERRQDDLVVTGVAETGAIRPMLVFGSGYDDAVRVGRALFQGSPAFREIARDCARSLQALLPAPLLSLLEGPADTDDLVTRDVLLFVVQCAAIETWRTWGVHPGAVLASGAGEPASLYAAGALTMEDAARLAVARARRSAAPSDLTSYDAVRASLGWREPQVDILPAAPDGGAIDWQAVRDACARLRCRALVDVVAPDVDGTGETGGIPLLRTSGAAGGEWDRLLAAAGALYVMGAAIDWAGFDAGRRRQKVVLPTYPFDRQRYWLPTEADGSDERNAYSLTWVDAPAPAAQPPAPDREPWLIFTDAAGVGDALAERLERLRHTVVRVRTGGPYRAEGSSAWISPDASEDYERLWREYRDADGPTFAGVVDLRPMDAADRDNAACDLAVTVCTRTLDLLKTVVRADKHGPPATWIVTRASQPALEVSPDPAQAAVWGLVRTAVLEHADLRCTRVDLDVGIDVQRDADFLLEVLLASDAETEVARRGTRRLAPRLASMASAAVHPVQMRRDGTYLVTGGLGALGLGVARALAARGAGHVVLVGRRAPSDAAAAAIAAIEGAGCRVSVEPGDVSRAGDVARITGRIAESGAPLRGIVHAAGVLDDGVLIQQDAARVAAIFAPKAAGACNLRDATLGLPLDFFVMFSSVAAVIGSRGQSSYGAANAFLDAFAHSLRSRGVPAVSINWGPWAEGGMAAGDARARRWAAAGIEPLSTERGVAAFERLLGLGEPQVTVLQVDWARCARSFSPARVPSMLADLVPGQDAPTVQDSRPALLRLMAGRGMRAPEEVAIAFVTAELGAVVGLEPGTIDPRRGLQELGLDSLMALDLRERLQSGAGRALPSTLAFDYPSVEALSNYLLTEVLETKRPGGTPVQRPAGQDDLLMRIEDLSDEQVEQLLARRGAADTV